MLNDDFPFEYFHFQHHLAFTGIKLPTPALRMVMFLLEYLFAFY